MLKSLKPDILFYSEPSGPLARQVVDLTYNYDEEWLSGSLMEVVSEKGYAGSRAAVNCRVTARDVVLWLHHRRLALPPGAEKAFAVEVTADRAMRLTREDDFDGLGVWAP